jgi:hypothetical protein
MSEQEIDQLKSQLAIMTAERDRLKKALEELYAYQNGCPLPSYEQGWNAAMTLAQDALRGELKNAQATALEHREA